MADDLDLKILIRALLDSKGFEEAQQRIKGVGDAGKAAAPGLADLASKQEVSKREVRLLSAELLRSIGMTEGAGVAGRLAAESYVALGNSANYANVALTGGALLVVTLLPKIIEWISKTKEQTAEQKALADTLSQAEPELKDYLDKLKLINPQLAEMAEHIHRVEMDKLTPQMKAAAEKVHDAQLSFDGASEALRDFKDNMLESETEAPGVVRRMGELETKVRVTGDALQAAKDEQKLLNDAITAGETPAELLAKQHETDTKTLDEKKNALKKLIEVYDELSAREKRAFEGSMEEAAFFANFAAQQDVDAEKDIQNIGKINAARDKKTIADTKATLAELKLGKEREKADREELRRKEEIAVRTEQMWVQAVTTAVTAFTKNKAINIAAAIADTWAGVAGVLKMYPGPPGWAMAAVQAAQGLATVVNIEKASVGFDDPFSDRVAAKMGRQSAIDFAKFFGGEFSRNLPGAMQEQTVNNYQITNQNGVTLNGGYHSHAIVGAKRTQQMKELYRELVIVGGRNYKRGTIGGQ